MENGSSNPFSLSVGLIILARSKEDSSLNGCAVLVAPVLCVPVMFYLKTLVCWLQDKGRRQAWACGVMEKAGVPQGTWWHLFALSSWTVEFSFHRISFHLL